MQISSEAANEAYQLGKRVYLGNLRLPAAIEELKRRVAINSASADGTLRNVVHLLRGEKYTRTNSLPTISIFLNAIFEEFGAKEQSHAVSAVEQHLEYYLTKSGSAQLSLKAICAQYKEQIATSVEDEPPAIRILPMSNDLEFAGQSIEDLQHRFFLQEFPSRPDGQYYFRKHAIDTPRGALVLFQANAHIVASAVYQGRGSAPADTRYKGSLLSTITRSWFSNPSTASVSRPYGRRSSTNSPSQSNISIPVATPRSLLNCGM